MKKIDFRTIDEKSRYHIRVRAIRMVEKGIKKQEIAAIFGVRNATITLWVHLYETLGNKGLQGKKRGVKSEQVKLLSRKLEAEIIRLITDKNPEQYKLNFALWTRKAVKELIKNRYGIELAVNTVGDYLRSWGFTPQKPIKRAYEQNAKAVEKWMNEDYPQIKERAKREKAEIQWGDETGIKNCCNHGRGYAPIGQTPVKRSMSLKFSVNMVSTVTNQGMVRFMIYTDKMNSDKLIEFMKLLIKKSKQKIFLILDNLKVHHSRPVKEWLAENIDKIEVFYLPSYSPERNPDEYLNCDLKQGMFSKPAPRNKEKLSKNVTDHMKMLVKNPNRVKKYFKHKYINYAA